MVDPGRQRHKIRLSQPPWQRKTSKQFKETPVLLRRLQPRRISKVSQFLIEANRAVCQLRKSHDSTTADRMFPEIGRVQVQKRSDNDVASIGRVGASPPRLP